MVLPRSGVPTGRELHHLPAQGIAGDGVTDPFWFWLSVAVEVIGGGGLTAVVYGYRSEVQELREELGARPDRGRDLDAVIRWVRAADAQLRGTADDQPSTGRHAHSGEIRMTYIDTTGGPR